MAQYEALDCFKLDDRQRLQPRRFLYSQSCHGSRSCPGGQLSGPAAVEAVGAAAADGRAGKRAAGAHMQDTGQRDQEPDRPGSHA